MACWVSQNRAVREGRTTNRLLKLPPTVACWVSKGQSCDKSAHIGPDAGDEEGAAAAAHGVLQEVRQLAGAVRHMAAAAARGQRQDHLPRALNSIRIDIVETMHPEEHHANWAKRTGIMWGPQLFWRGTQQLLLLQMLGTMPSRHGAFASRTHMMSLCMRACLLHPPARLFQEG